MKYVVKSLTAAAMAMLLCLSMTACGESMTAESLMNGFEKQAESAAGVSMDMSMNMGMALSMFGESADFTMDGTFHVEAVDPNVHMTATMSIEAEGESETEDMEMYVMKEDSGYVQYMNTYGSWTKTVLGDSEAFDMDLTELSSEQLTLDEKKDSNGNYVVRSVIDLNEALDVFGSAMADADPDFSDIFESDVDIDMPSVEAVYTFDGKTKELVSMSIDMSEAMKTYVDAAMKASFQAGLSGIGEEGDTSADMDMPDFDLSSMMSIDVTAMKITVSNVKYSEKADPITLPAEAAAAEMDNGWETLD